MRIIFQWVLLTLTSYRIQRIITTDSWPPSIRLRRYVHDRFGSDSSWCDFITCPFCAGTWLTFATFAVAAQFLNIPSPVLQAIAASAIVGLIGTRD